MRDARRLNESRVTDLPDHWPGPVARFPARPPRIRRRFWLARASVSRKPNGSADSTAGPSFANDGPVRLCSEPWRSRSSSRWRRVRQRRCCVRAGATTPPRQQTLWILAAMGTRLPGCASPGSTHATACWTSPRLFARRSGGPQRVQPRRPARSLLSTASSAPPARPLLSSFHRSAGRWTNDRCPPSFGSESAAPGPVCLATARGLAQPLPSRHRAHGLCATSNETRR